MSDRHGGAGLVASLHSAVFAESDIESLVNERLVGVIVIWQQGLLELALVFKGGLEKKREITKSETWTNKNWADLHNLDKIIMQDHTANY